MRRSIFLLISLTFFVFHFAHADTASDQARIQQLQAKIDALEAQAAQFRGSIAQQHAKADSLNKEIGILKSQIGAIQAQIAATDAKIDKTQLEIGDVQDKIGQTQQVMSRKRETIGRMVLFLDAKDHEDLLASLFKYANLSDFLSQIHDLADVQDRIMEAISGLKEVKLSLENDQAELQSKQTDLEKLKDEAAQRKAALDGTTHAKAKLLADTKGQEALYKKQVANIEGEKAELFKELRQLELKVISGGLYIVHITAKNVPPRGTKIFQMPEDSAVLTQGYGCTKRARCGSSRGAYGGSPHNGIDLSGGYGSPIKAIGDGQIVANGSNNAWGNWVAIQHTNDMTSIYAHMSSLSPLKVGSKVTVGQTIGYEGSTGNSTGSHLHLSLYKEFFTYIRDKDGQLFFNYFEGTVNPLDYL